ncbi:UDP-glucose 6-dehydrogenase TuaD [Evansella halocellulosilytica]|uniref:UDP-glucose 6-dehydrogenase TuaD n=1 Tax=Evansella halocellulosilytica TaxID=2011013 RepID=UPI000BB902C2|nr:UDP-glucose/GDP-mannose dehydrogenase family protein [Evansella halocellulosilytica]
MKKIAVMGTGYVGLVSGTCFSEVGNQVICCDIDESKITMLNEGKIPIYEPGLEELVKKNVDAGRLSFSTNISEAISESNVIYIGVGTPMAESGEADLTYVKNVAKTVGENLNRYKIIVNKSTVPVGTGKLVQQIVKEQLQEDIEFDVVSNPEFLREGSAVADTMNMERAVIGATSEKAANIIKQLHEPFNTKIISTNVESAEMIKYASNAFLATKISFINDIANICERVGADVTKVAEGMGLDSRIGAKFLQAGIGYGGSCFPKDTQALVHIAEQVGYDFKMVKAVIETNQHQKMKVVTKLKDIVPKLQGKKIAVLGLAFKPNTDDMRDAPSLDIIPALLNEGATITAFDPIAIEEAKHHFGERIHYSLNVEETLKGAEACLILTDWQEVLDLDLKKVNELLKQPIVIDGRNCFKLEDAEEANLIYHSIGRPDVK